MALIVVGIPAAVILPQEDLNRRPASKGDRLFKHEHRLPRLVAEARPGIGAPCGRRLAVDGILDRTRHAAQLAAVVEDLPPDPDVCRHGQLRSWAASGADEEQALASFDG